MNTPRRIGIIEDQELFLELLTDLCKTQLGYDVVFTAVNATTGLIRLHDTKPDAVLLDINLPDGDGLTIAQRLRDEKMALKIIILSGDTTAETLKRVRQSGVDAYVSKNSYSTCLRQALENVLDHNRTYFSPVTAAKNRSPYAKILTERELQLLPFVAVGYGDSEIASALGLSANTVRKHREHIMSKLDLESRPHLLRFCFEKGFLKTKPDGGLILPQWSNNTK